MIKNILFFRYHPQQKDLGSQPVGIIKQLGLYPPMGLAYLAAVCQQAGYKVKILDAYALNLPPEKIKEEVLSFSPDVVCLSLWTSTFEGDMAGVRLLKEIKNDLIIVVGGPHMDLYSKETLVRYPLIDYGVVGEGERTMKELLDALKGEREIISVKGIIFRQKNEIIQTPDREPIQNLDEIPIPLIKELPLERYHTLLSGGHRGMYMYVLTARGCPFKCKHCTDHQFGRTVRFHSADYIVKYLKHLVEDLGVKEIDIYDDTFTINRKRALDICQKITAANLNKIKWTIRTRPDTVDEEILSALRKAGCYRIIYGVESGNQTILDIMNRRTKLEQIVKTFKLSKKYGIEIVANFMIGYLGESKKTFRQSIEFAKKLDPDYAKFSITAVMPNSDLYREMEGKGFFIKDQWRDYASGKIKEVDPNHARIAGEDYSVGDLDKMLSWAYIAFYFRPKLILRYLRKNSSPRQILGYIKMATTMLRLHFKNSLNYIFSKQ